MVRHRGPDPGDRDHRAEEQITMSTAQPHRHHLTGGLSAGLAALLLFCGCATTDTDGGVPAADTSWSFTDDLGRTTDLAARPQRIAGLNDPLASLWSYGIVPVAAFGYTSIRDDERFANRDTSGVVVLGSGYGQLDVEALAVADPDVIVTHAYPTSRGGDVDPDEPLYGFADLSQQQAAEAVAPIIVLEMSGSAVDVTQRHAELATALGVPADTGLLPESRARYEASAAAFRTSATSGISTAFVHASAADGVHVARPADDPSLSSATALGLQAPDLGGGKFYWTVLSWENVDAIEADVIFWSQLGGLTGDEMVQTQPTFARLPAASSGQLAPWVFATMDWTSQADNLDSLSGVLSSAQDVA